MDKSTEYIKMSERGFRLLPLWKHHEGDWYYDRRYIKISIITKQDLLPENIGVFEEFKNEFIPLYGQDQLQAMLWSPMTATDIYGWLGKVRAFQMKQSYASMEQLWLAFVIFQQYQKHWTGSEWIKELTEEEKLLGEE